MLLVENADRATSRRTKERAQYSGTIRILCEHSSQNVSGHGEIGRRPRLKISYPQGCAGSIPAGRTT